VAILEKPMAPETSDTGDEVLIHMSKAVSAVDITNFVSMLSLIVCRMYCLLLPLFYFAMLFFSYTTTPT
jgi:hypothetical protein